MILSDEGLWDDPRLSDCILWLATVVCSPRKAEIVPHDIWEALQGKILGQRPELKYLAEVENILHRFFCPEARAAAWKQAWAAKMV